MDLLDKELVAEFVVESQEGLAGIENQLLAIEAGGAEIDTDLVNSVFRTMHSIKGASGFFGLDSIQSLAHGLEEVLDDLRNREIIPTSELVTAVLRAADFMTGLMDAIETSNEADVAPFVQELKSFQCGSSDEPAAQAPDSQPAAEPLVEIEPTETEPNRDGSEIETAAPPQPTETLPAPPTGAPKDDPVRSSSVESTIRVDVSLLDRLMTRVGELVLARNQILQHTNHTEDSGLLGSAQRLSLITTELQEDVMKTRMQPIGNVWAKFPRVVRDLSSQLGKQVRIEMEGKETELDKTIIESIKDPLTHLVRNSIDHGCESPEARVRAGKPAEGCLSLRAYHEGGQVVIEIADDGAGLNLERIREKAVERGLVKADQASQLSEREIAQLVLLPGFSTAEKVTSVSGRGVGMDVVKTNIERIGGVIDLESHPGRGTTVRIRIPLTLAIIPALIISNGGSRYAIPQVSLLELLRLEGEQIERGIEYVHGTPVLRVRGSLLPLVNLSQRLGLSSAAVGATSVADQPLEDRVVNIVVLRSNDQQFGVVVDAVNDTEEIVVKPLGRQLKGVSEFAGATIMGDGTVVLILDVAGLAAASGIGEETNADPQTSLTRAEESSSHPVESLVVVDLGDTRRFALPMSMVSRLEQIPVSAVEYANGQEVVQYRDKIMPLVRLSDVFGKPQQSGPPSEDMQVVVYVDQNHSCGLVVHRIVDIVETELPTLPENSDDNLLGTIVVGDRVTDILNLRQVTRPMEKTSLFLES